MSTTESDKTPISYPFDMEKHIPIIKKYLCCSRVSTLVNGKQLQGIYCGLLNECMFHAAYPIITQLGDANKTTLFCDPRGTGAKYLLGVPNPKYVFTILKEAFKDAYPEVDPSQWLFWEVVHCNQALYGHQTSQKAPSLSNILVEKMYEREMVGEKVKPSTIWLKEATYRRYKSAIPMEHVFENKIRENKKQVEKNEVVVEESTFPQTYLSNMATIYQQFKENIQGKEEKPYRLAPDVIMEAIKKAQEETDKREMMSDDLF